MTSCWTVDSIARTRSTSKRAFARIAAAAGLGIAPAAARASQTASSTSSQRFSLCVSSQSRVISGRA